MSDSKKKKAEEHAPPSSVREEMMPLFRHDLGTEEEYEAVVASVDIVDMGGGDSGKSIDTTTGANAKPPTFWQRWWSPLVYIFYLWVRCLSPCCLVWTPWVGHCPLGLLSPGLCSLGLARFLN